MKEFRIYYIRKYGIFYNVYSMDLDTSSPEGDLFINLDHEFEDMDKAVEHCIELNKQYAIVPKESMKEIFKELIEIGGVTFGY